MKLKTEKPIECLLIDEVPDGGTEAIYSFEPECLRYFYVDEVKQIKEISCKDSGYAGRTISFPRLNLSVLEVDELAARMLVLAAGTKPAIKESGIKAYFNGLDIKSWKKITIKNTKLAIASPPYVGCYCKWSNGDSNLFVFGHAIIQYS